MDNSRNRYVVGIDFGTTYSGIAYLYVDPEKGPDYSNIKIIRSWPDGGGGIENQTLEKVPTTISYEEDETRWGYEIPIGAKRYGYFKLLLDKSASKRTYDDPSLTGEIKDDILPSLPRGTTASDITFEYLRLLYEHVLDKLREHIESTFDITPIHFILTVPAIWSHAAQRITRNAAERAGFGSRNGDIITMVSEPEAAGAYCLNGMQKGSGNELKVKERILICDAGGGTVDLATYSVSEITPCMRVREAVTGSGGKCGSTAIDRAFIEWVTPLVGRDKRGRLLETGPGSMAMTIFEAAKRSFGTSKRQQKWRIPVGNVPDDELNGIENGELLLTGKQMAKFFEPVVEMIISLVSKQIRDANNKGSKRDRNKVSKILLVGGFGESKYLRGKLQEHCQAQSFPINVVTPMDTWTAVVRGAVIQGIESLVDSRKLRENYGAILGPEYNSMMYDPFQELILPRDRSLNPNDHVQWFALKGEEAANGQNFSIGGCKDFPGWLEKKFVIHLVGSDQELGKGPISARRGKAYPIGLVEADLSSVPDSAFTVRCTNCVRCGGRLTFQRAEITVEMSIASADLKFEVMFQGASYGSTRIKYHHDGMSDHDVPSIEKLSLY